MNEIPKDTAPTAEKPQTSKPNLFNYEQVEKSSKRNKIVFIVMLIALILGVVVFAQWGYPKLKSQITGIEGINFNADSVSNLINEYIPETNIPAGNESTQTLSEFQQLMQAGNYSEVISKAEQQLSGQLTDQQQAEARYWLGASHYVNGSYDKAEQELQKVLAIEPENPQVNYLLAEINWMQGDSATCLPYAQKAAELQPNFAEIYAILGSCSLNIGDRTAATEAFRKALELNPDNQNYQRALDAIGPNR